MGKLSLLIECDTQKKLGTVVKLDVEERNKRMMDVLSTVHQTNNVKDLLDKLRLPQIEESHFSHHLLVFEDENQAKNLFDVLIKYNLNPRIYDMCYGKISPKETMEILA